MSFVLRKSDETVRSALRTGIAEHLRAVIPRGEEAQKADFDIPEMLAALDDAGRQLVQLAAQASAGEDAPAPVDPDVAAKRLARKTPMERVLFRSSFEVPTKRAVALAKMERDPMVWPQDLAAGSTERRRAKGKLP